MIFSLTPPVPGPRNPVGPYAMLATQMRVFNEARAEDTPITCRNPPRHPRASAATDPHSTLQSRTYVSACT